MTQSGAAHTVGMSHPRGLAAHGSRPAGGSRLDSLTGLRFFAAGIVFLHHAFELTTGTLREALTAVFGHGRAGVSFFFLLSGFVLAWSMQPGDKATSFWRRRWARLWPAYVVATLAGYLVSRFWDGRFFSIERLAANLSMVQAWIPAKDWYFSVNSVNWSLSVEAFFYLTFPLYARSILRMRVRPALALGGTLFAGILVFALAFGHDIVLGGGWQLPDTPGVWIVYISPVVRIMEFVLGIVLVSLLRQGALPVVPVWLAWTSLGLAWVAAGKVPAGFAVVAVTVIPFCLLILAYAQRDAAAPRSTFWSSKGLVFLGNISFCFYLAHQLVLRAFAAEVGQGWIAASTGVRSLKVLALVLGVSLLAAWALHAFVEKPMERVLRGRGRPAASLPGSAAVQAPLSPAPVSPRPDPALSNSVWEVPVGRHRGAEISAPRQRSR